MCIVIVRDVNENVAMGGNVVFIDGVVIIGGGGGLEDPGRKIRARGDITPAEVLEVEHTFTHTRGRCPLTSAV